MYFVNFLAISIPFEEALRWALAHIWFSFDLCQQLCNFFPILAVLHIKRTNVVLILNRMFSVFTFPHTLWIEGKYWNQPKKWVRSKCNFCVLGRNKHELGVLWTFQCLFGGSTTRLNHERSHGAVISFPYSRCPWFLVIFWGSRIFIISRGRRIRKKNRKRAKIEDIFPINQWNYSGNEDVSWSWRLFLVVKFDWSGFLTKIEAWLRPWSELECTLIPFILFASICGKVCLTHITHLVFKSFNWI